MNRRGNNHSTERALEERRSNTRINYERKCHTPSNQNHSTKKSSKIVIIFLESKTKEEKKPHHNSKHQKHLQINIQQQNPKKDSPFKHKSINLSIKDRPHSNLNNIRHARHLEHQLSNLNESAAYDSIMEDSGKKIRAETVTHKAILEGKKLMKNNQFERGLAIFSECTQRDPNSLEALYLLGVCAFHLEHYDESIKYFNELLNQEPQYRKNAYLFLAISFKKRQHNEDALLIVPSILFS